MAKMSDVYCVDISVINTRIEYCNEYIPKYIEAGLVTSIFNADTLCKERDELIRLKAILKPVTGLVRDALDKGEELAKLFGNHKHETKEDYINNHSFCL